MNHCINTAILLCWLTLWACSPPEASIVAQDAEGTASNEVEDAEEREPDPRNLPSGWVANPTEQRCSLPPAPALGNMELETVVASSQLTRPIWVGPSPLSTEALWIVEQGGKILSVSNEGVLQTILDLSVSRAGNEEGLLGLALHPEFESNQRLFVYFSASNPRRSVVAEFNYNRNESKIDATATQIVMEIEQPFGNHNGGDMHFGPDGFLYVSLGDGGGAGDPFGYAQDTNSLLGSILRIDVDEMDETCMTNYKIPNDNPFAGEGCGTPDGPRPEIWAWGLRNVWRMSFDPGSGQLWGGDVGQNQKEEINIFVGGLNYGWRPVEADICYENGCTIADFAPPVHSYAHDVGESVTGGIVYRGSVLQALYGRYIFGDYETGRIWALDEDQQAQLLTESGRRITSFGTDKQGNALVVSFNGGIEKLQPVVGSEESVPFPTRLSETGCISNNVAEALDAQLTPYFVNHPFWSDGLEKSRYFSLPRDTRLIFEGDEPVEVPIGTVIVKNFSVSGANGVPLPIETRLIHREADRWSAFTYAWNTDGSDAYLVEQDQTIPVFVDGRTIEWPLMTRSKCDKCHIQGDAYPLGLTARQLQRQVTYSEGPSDQIEYWVEKNIATFEGMKPPPHTYPDAESATLDERARTYLDVNCSSCHQPGVVGEANIDLRLTTAWRETNLCGIRSDRDWVGTPEGYLVKPGSPEESILYARVQSLGEYHMPPLGSDRVDEAGVELLGSWIQAMGPCE